MQIKRPDPHPPEHTDPSAPPPPPTAAEEGGEDGDKKGGDDDDDDDIPDLVAGENFESKVE